MKRARILILCLFAAGLFVGTGAAQAASCASPLASLEMLPSRLASEADLAALRTFYAPAPGQCLWSKTSEAALRKALQEAERHGLAPEQFLSLSFLQSLGSEQQALRDLLLSRAALAYAQVMRRGQLPLESLGEDVDFPRLPLAPEAGLRAALAAGDVAGWLEAQPPATAAYKKLLEAYAQYRALNEKGGWALLPAPEKSLKPGMLSPLVPLLRARLLAEGDLAQASAVPLEPQLYDAALAAALEAFQARNGLKADGVLGRATLAHLNISAAERVTTIMLNLERWRMLAAGLPPTRFEVNAAAAEAVLYEGDQPHLQMRTIVGAKKTPTPIMRSAIDMVVINPPWVVPRSILVKEIEPLLKTDPDYLARHQMSWQEGQLVQAPGEKNSLGRIKFEMPSSFGVFLHDTPARSLFASEARARSHGCIRLEKPLEFAAYLLRKDAAWPSERIEQAIAEGATQRIPLVSKMPVAIVYWTAFVNDAGRVEFRDDVYGRDARLYAALLQSQSYPVAARTVPPLIGCKA